MAIMQKPPMLTGDAGTDLRQMRDYLFRLAGSLQNIETATAEIVSVRMGTAAATGGGAASTADEQAAVERMRQNAASLRALILKTARDIESEMDSREEEYYGYFRAKSDYGDLDERYELMIDTNAQRIVESYGYDSQISSIDNAVQRYTTQINGEIRRGFIEDPDRPGSLIFGIAISSTLQFTGSVQTKDGYEYHELEPRQTFGFYTSTGWQFWIDGQKAGWFDSTGEGVLHVRKVVAEDYFQVGGKWQMKIADGGAELEFVYVGDA